MHHAMQVENEYGHVGGLRGAAGEQHMRTLTKLAKTIGFEAPYWTATGWGGAVLGDLTPVMGGYCDAPWDASLKQLPPNKNYLFSTVRMMEILAVIMRRAWNCHLIKMRIRI